MKQLIHGFPTDFPVPVLALDPNLKFHVTYPLASLYVNLCLSSSLKYYPSIGFNRAKAKLLKDLADYGFKKPTGWL